MMVGFYTVFRRDPGHYVCADLLTRSVHTVMPGVEVVQLTDETSPAVVGVDAVRRRPHGKMLERRLEHYAAVDGDWLLLDTDVMVQRDVRSVFDDQFYDVALADRRWPLVKDDPAIAVEMPYNTGVAFTRCPAFWQTVLSVWRAFTSEQQAQWFSEQRAVASVVSSGQFHVKVLPGLIYNRPPSSATEDVSDAAIVHYKGPTRKPWMFARLRQGYAAHDDTAAGMHFFAS